MPWWYSASHSAYAQYGIGFIEIRMEKQFAQAPEFGLHSSEP